VTTVEALAHADVPQLMLRTRIPAPQLLDWVDQAILYIHLGRSRGGREYRQERLAVLGIRTATNLLCAAGATTGACRTVIARAILDRPRAGMAAPTKAEASAALDVLVCALTHETWIECLQAWHRTSPDAPSELVFERRGNGWVARMRPVAPGSA
jgi:hypothetical protein